MTTLIVARGESPYEADYTDDVSLIYNGRFESDVVGLLGWDSTGNDEDNIITRDTVAPINGTGSLKCVIDNDTRNAGAFVRIPLFFLSQNTTFSWVGRTLRLTFLYKGTGLDLDVYVDWQDAPDVFVAWSGTAGAEAQMATTDFVVPADASDLQLYMGTAGYPAPGGQTGTYWLDDVVLKLLADD